VTDAVSRLAGRRIAVIGDVMLDHFLVGRVDRISPEAPVPVVRYERDEHRLGGAANVAHNIVALNGTAQLVGVVGADAAAEELRRQLQASALDVAGLVVDESRPTTRKVRVVTSRNQQVARIDYEADAALSPGVQTTLLEAASRAVRAADAVVLSDYRKGGISDTMIAAVVAAASDRRTPILVDPKVPKPDRYRGVTVITPNHHEAEVMAQMAIRTAADVREAARSLHERTGASVIITWGEHGMWVLDAMDRAVIEEHLTAAAREVADVTGAGDTVIAVLALGLASGATLTEAARLANHAAGLVVARFGPAAVTAAELQAVTGATGR
jgi:D-beta-D-heptose 7-phosphate kinase/D-beta-D-heptose 1-phosphate adenosyltransferase